MGETKCQQNSQDNLVRMSKGDWKGAKWEGKLYYTVGKKELDLNNLQEIFSLDEKVKEVIVYSETMEGLRWQKSISLGLVSHSFVVFKTDSGAYYSLEKDQEGIWIERGSSIEELLGSSGRRKTPRIDPQ